MVVDAAHVREVAPLEQVTVLPLAPPEVAGLTQLRGRILAVLRPGAIGTLKDAALVIVEHAGVEAALWVDRVWGVGVVSGNGEPLDLAALFARVGKGVA